VSTVLAQSSGITPGDSYAAATLTVPFNACLGVDPDDLRVAIVSTVTGNEELSFAELRVTQIEVDLND